MSTSTTNTVESDFSVDIETGHVVVQRVGANVEYKIIAAKFFSKSRLEISEAICLSEKVYNDPDDPEIQYKIVFYSTLPSCKIKFRSLTDAAVVYSRPKGCNNQRMNRELKGLSSDRTRNERTTRSNRPTIDTSEMSSGFNAIRRAIELSTSKLEAIMRQVLERFDSLEERSSNGHAKIQDTSLSTTDMAMQAMQNCRTNLKWRQQIKNMSIEDLTNDQLKAVQKIMLSGNKFPSKMAISLGKVIFGDLLRTHLLGENGRSKRIARDGERSQVIPESMEEILRDLLKKFDSDLFTDQPGWDLLVRGPINQSGREEKRSRNSKRGNESENDENEKSKKQKAGPSQAVPYNEDDGFNSDSQQSTLHGHDDHNQNEQLSGEENESGEAELTPSSS